MAQDWEAKRLRIYLGERDAHKGRPLAEALVRSARDHGLAGATVFRGVEGYGVNSRIHSLHPLTLSADLPVLVEIIDVPARIEAFVPVVLQMLTAGALVTLDDVTVVLYKRAGADLPPPGGKLA